MKNNSRLNRKRWSRKKKKILLVCGSIAAVTVFLVNLGAVVNSFRDTFSRKGLKIVDLAIGENDTIDVKMRNTGNDIVYLKQINIALKRKWNIITDGNLNTYQQQPTGSYDLFINNNKPTPFTISRKLSQVIKPGETDRFLLALKSNPASDYSSVYLAEVFFVSNEDDCISDKKEVSFSFEMPLQQYDKKISNNRDALDEIKKLQCEKSIGLVALISKIDKSFTLLK